MFSKIKLVIGIIAAVVVAEVIGLAAMPAYTEIATTANASANFTGYPGAEAGVIGLPMMALVLPPVVGFIAIVITLLSDRLKNLIGS